MSAVELIGLTLRSMGAELLAWRLWAARKICDCEAHAQLGSHPTLADIDRHRDGCRYKIVATDLGETE